MRRAKLLDVFTWLGRTGEEVRATDGVGAEGIHRGRVRGARWGKWALGFDTEREEGLGVLLSIPSTAG